MNDSKTPQEAGLYDPEPASETLKPAAEAPPQILDDEGPSPEVEGERERAFRSESLAWNGKKLRPWSSAREGIWLELRHAMGGRHLSECVLSSYTFLPDAFRILYLCHGSEAEISEARSSPQKLQAAVDEWANKYVPIAQHEEAITLAMRIYNLAHKNHPEAAPSPDVENGDDLGN